MKRWRAKQKHRAKKRRLYKDRCRTLRDISPEAWTEAFDEVQELVDLSIQNEDRGHVYDLVCRICCRIRRLL